ncbi:hypothetical protein JUM41_25670 [Rhizobium pusense]|uniref:aldose epimerase family protein n=1 Tax=Agrobacterium pusense TaxID=648995 RepID=UPI001FCCD06E|nr:hypothetical protein [Agrobacterium pusense]MCJ2877634.1 hypothetical protein [Agrobacterium pusense]
MSNILHGADVHSIAAGGLRARFCPGMGGRLLNFGLIDGAEVLIAGDPHDFEATSWPRAGAYPLIPYHNRISDAAISVGNEIFALRPHPASLPHTLHGPSHARAWTAGPHSDKHFEMHVDYVADEDWPWDFHAIQRFEISETGLRLEIELENRSGRPMPAGLGWHPYFASRVPVTCDARVLWPHAPDYLPTGSHTALSGNNDAVTAQTAYLDGWTQADVQLGGGLSVRLKASPVFRFLVVHRGDPAHICVEPVTHVANGWNLPLPSALTGAVVLSAQQSLKGSIELVVAGFSPPCAREP